jgi:periplasmic protein CpxP/Spy
MRQLYFWSMVLVLVPLAPALGQQADSANPRRADSLRQRIEERFASRVQSELGLTNEQTAKLQAASKTFGARRRDFRNREEGLREALSGQLRPGVAANQDSVAKLTDAMIELRVASAQAARDEMKELSKFLSPVQRARLYVMRERLYHRVRDADRHRGWERRRAKDRSWM